MPVAALVGGGVGIPPLVYLATELAKRGKEVTAFCGARSAERLPLTIIPGARVSADGEPSDCAVEFSLAGVRTAVCTDDGSLGCRGFVSDAFRRWLDKRELAGHGAAVYCCGPEAMMQAVAQICLARDMPCQLALERHMACGVGTCQSCAVKIRSDNDRGWAYKLCCTDGPVFSAEEVLW